MSYYFAIVGTKDNPLFEHEFGTSKQGGDGVARFREEARHMNQFIVHSSLDIVEEVQWGNGQMYLKVIDRFYNNYVSCFLTGGNIKFLLLHAPTTPKAIRSFFVDVYEIWVKTLMNPFYHIDMEVRSPVFRSRVVAAGRKYL
ncbi:trafficking protein-like protein particle complex subunit 2 [Xylona heveae TC161]|uniref:Trafficking protein-like protein particle complex subunit 2 n=1 Tax=Xylona heveae (strain CBS 132557 / TC161) TaxID=1328760 RepID=A0A165G154_XYLHT|nr:trafficking protein-like protein particle complex subunit 2 [Xylona heveae TC161]KZF21620.1 trafficking protein-like protein particle complex subunit 2 [Xylona heveae TC161]